MKSTIYYRRVVWARYGAIDTSWLLVRISAVGSRVYTTRHLRFWAWLFIPRSPPRVLKALAGGSCRMRVIIIQNTYKLLYYIVVRATQDTAVRALCSEYDLKTAETVDQDYMQYLCIGIYFTDIY